MAEENYDDIDPYQANVFPSKGKFIVEGQLVYGKQESGSFVYVDGGWGELVMIEFDTSTGDFVFVEIHQEA
jgi:hypothetical protein